MEAPVEGVPRTYRIRRSQHHGYGFVAGYERPTMVKIIIPEGPSYKRLLPGDVIMAVNGIEVEDISREQIIKMIQLSDEEIEIKVRQPTYEELIRAKNLADPKFYMFNSKQPNEQKQHVDLHQLNNITRPTNGIHSTTSPNSSMTSSRMTLNRLITPISQQKPLPTLSTSDSLDGDKQSMQASMNNNILKQRSDENGSYFGEDKNNNLNYGASTLGRNGRSNYGRHSPMPQRCKSSMSGTQTLKPGNKKSGDNDNQPLLKRSNTMRPIRPSAKVMEIFEVVIRIFFEDGHTRVLNYNQDTTVGTILENLYSRLIGSSTQADEVKSYFGLALTVNSEGGNLKEQQMHKRKLLHILDDNDSIMKIRQLPYAPKLRLLYRMISPPSDVMKLYTQNKVAFEYLYKQSCNDLKSDRFCPELDSETALKLSALHLVEYVYTNFPKAHGNSKDAKVYMRLAKKTPGINHFLPASLIESISDKKGKLVVSHYKKLKARLSEQVRKNFEEFDFEPPKVKSTTNLNRYTSTSFHELSLPEFKSSPSDCIKLVFLNYLSQLPCYGNTKRPAGASTSPIERGSVGECSSSIESVPRTSDSSPLIKQERNQVQQQQQNFHNRVDQMDQNSVSRMAHMNSMRSLNSIQPQHTRPSLDQPDMAQTPSIESISSITFNTQSTPSPQHISSYVSQSTEKFITPELRQHKPTMVEPSPMPRQQMSITSLRQQEYNNSIERLYDQRYHHIHVNRSVDELLRTAMMPPPPPPVSQLLYDDLTSNISNYRHLTTKQMNYVTPVITDQELERLRVPPPPRLKNRI